MSKVYTPATAAVGVEGVLRLLEGRWKLIILFHLFGGKVQRYSDFEKLIPGISQKMLAQQLRQLEADGMVLTARGSEQHAKGTDTVGAWINFCLATGRAGRPLSGYRTTTPSFAVALVGS